jgi:hypothetical protein
MSFATIEEDGRASGHPSFFGTASFRLSTLRTGACWATLAAALLVAACASTPAVPLAVPRAANAIVVDGLANEWEGIPTLYLESSVRVLGAARDGENLFLMFRYSDSRLEERLDREGVMLWLDAGGQRARSFGIRYGGVPGRPPGRPHGRGSEASPERRGAPPPERGSGGFTLVRGEEKEIVPPAADRGAVATTARAEGSSCFELRIPLAEIPGYREGTTAIDLGIEIGGMTETERKELEERRNERGGQGPPGGGGGPGGGMGGGRGGGRGGGMGGPGGGRGGPGGGGGSHGPNRDAGDSLVWVSLRIGA